MTAGRVVLLVAGSLLALVGLALTIAGAAALIVYGTQRDADGYFTTRTERLETPRYALVSEELDLGARGEWSPVRLGSLARVRVRAQSARPALPLFVGIGPRREVDAYLAGVAHDQVEDVDFDPFAVEYRPQPGRRAPAPPVPEALWVARASGTGPQTLEWDLESGSWKLVLMNAGGQVGVSADVQVGLRVGILLGLGIGLLVGGLVLLGGGSAMIVLGARSRRDAGPPASGEPPAAGPLAGAEASDAAEEAARDPYPVRLEGDLDPRLSRWLWLVKWLLAIPHLIVLALLWIAFLVLSVIALFAILLTGRYPRGIFDFNVGVLRWSWRVAFYSYSALGTDRYPPFSLQPTDYPARLEVAYPEGLSRGLVLVKWWLLAIPHYLVVGIFGAGLWWWGASIARWSAGDWVWAGWGGGLVGVLVLIAGVWLLVTERYPRDIFTFVMGMNRWIYRVVAYAALMRDEYPPFRLDPGGEEPPRRAEPR